MTLPSSITDIGKSVFKDCINIKKVTVECNPESIWRGGLFDGCSNIEYINLPESIGDNIFFIGFIGSVFNDFKKLKSLKIPEGITEISQNAFFDYKDLEQLYIPSTVQTIDEFSFIGCDNLKLIEISEQNKNFYVNNNEIYNKEDICIYCPEEQKEECDVDKTLFSDKIEKVEGKDYVLFGYWPQSLKETDVILDKKHKYNICGFECYKGNTGGYYTNQQYSLVYKDNLLEDSLSYYKIESIKWVIASNNFQGKKLLLTKDVILYSSFAPLKKRGDYEVTDYNYQYSTARAFLNGLDGKEYEIRNFKNKGFIDLAFSKFAKIKISDVSLNNNIKDKIFLLSKSELAEIDSMEDFSYKPKFTSYVKSVCTSNDWWLRTEEEDSYSDYIYTNKNICKPKEIHGVVAALTIENDGVLVFENLEDKDCSKIIIKGYNENGDIINNKEKLIEILKKFIM